MSTTQVLGAVLCGLPFVVLFIVMARTDGWGTAVAIWLTALAFTAVLVAGVALLCGGLS